MRTLSTTILSGLLALAGCAVPDRSLNNTAVLHYQHVANVSRIDFSTAVMLPRRQDPVHFVQPLESEGFWAVFVLCSLDATGANIPAFYFDVERLRVQYAGQRYGALRPYALRLDESSDVNTAADTPFLAAAIDEELRTSPYSRVFRHGYYPGLDVRFAIFVPHALPQYAGSQLALRYEGGPAMALGNDYPPAQVASAGPGGTAVATHCLP